MAVVDGLFSMELDFGAAAFNGLGVPADTMEGYVWTKLAAEQSFPKAISNLSEMSGALTEEEREQAEKRVARSSRRPHQRWFA